MRTKLIPAGAVLALLSLTSACSDEEPEGVSTTGGGRSGANAGRAGGTAGSAATNAGSAAMNAGSAVMNAGSAADAGEDSGPDDAGAPGLAVELGTAGDYVILAKSGVSTVPTAAITGDVGVSPAAASYITGFTLTADSTNEFATSSQVTGRVYAADYASPTPSNMTTAISDMELAFTEAAARAPDVTELGAGDIGGRTLEPGVYKWGTGLAIPDDVTLSGSATAVFVFQVAQDLTMSSAKSIVLAGGALAENVFWQVSGEVVLGTTAHLEGIVLSQSSITLRTGASVNGRLLAQKAVVIDASTVVEP
jgi:hypothetical protein